MWDFHRFCCSASGQALQEVLLHNLLRGHPLGNNIEFHLPFGRLPTIRASLGARVRFVARLEGGLPKIDASLSDRVLPVALWHLPWATSFCFGGHHDTILTSWEDGVYWSLTNLWCFENPASARQPENKGVCSLTELVIFRELRIRVALHTNKPRASLQQDGVVNCLQERPSYINRKDPTLYRHRWRVCIIVEIWTLKAMVVWLAVSRFRYFKVNTYW